MISCNLKDLDMVRQVIVVLDQGSTQVSLTFFFITIQMWWKVPFALTQNVMRLSQQIVHMTRQLCNRGMCKKCSDIISRNGITMKLIFHRIWIVMKNCWFNGSRGSLHQRFFSLMVKILWTFDFIVNSSVDHQISSALVRQDTDVPYNSQFEFILIWIYSETCL